MQSPHKPLIYVASSREDEDLCQELLKHAWLLSRELGVEIWCDQHVSPGQETFKEQKAKLDRAVVILLLVSADFFSRDTVWEQVIDPARARYETDQAKVIPIRLREYDWGNVWFAKLRPIPSGTHSIFKSTDRDKDFAEVVATLRSILEQRRVVDETETPTFPSDDMLTQRRQDLAIAAFGDEAIKLADALSQEMDKRLEDLREDYRCGRHKEAISALHELREHHAWSSFTAALRGKILRTLAVFAVQDGCALETVDDLLRQASEINSGGEDRTARALLAYKRGQQDEALTITNGADQLSPRNFHLALLLEAQRLEAARVCLDEIKALLEPDAETWRLEAILALMNADLRTAREAIDTALAISPAWRALHETSAIIDFWRGFVPSALVSNHPFYPRPFSDRLVRMDDEAKVRRQGALKAFTDLQATSESQPNEPVTYDVWRFLCLIQEPATAGGGEVMPLLARILDSGRNLALTLSWAMSRGINFSRDHALNMLRQAPSERADYLDCQLVLCSLLLDMGRTPEVLNLLDQRRDAFQSAGKDSVWRYWRVQALLESEQVSEAEAIADVEADVELRWRMQLSCAEAQMSAGGDWRPLFELFDRQYHETHAISILLEACRLKAQAGEWSYPNEYADTALEASPTPSVVRLMAVAAWNAPDYSRCRVILEQYAYVYPGARLPEDMRSMRQDCLCRLGLLDEALENARRAWERSRSWNSLVALLDMHIRQNNLLGLANDARAILSFQAGNAMEALRVAEWLRQEHSDLAREIWRWALTLGSEVEAFPMAAMHLGLSLDMHHELAPIMLSVQQLAQAGSALVRVVQLDELPDLMASSHKRQEELQRMYDKGAVVVHLLGEGRPLLADIYHAFAESNRQEPDPRRRTPLMIHHGARPTASLGAGYRFQGKLVMDVTALLLAHELGILEWVERRFGPIQISPRALVYLGWERSQLVPGQPDRLRAIKSLAGHIRTGGVRLSHIAPTSPDSTDEFQQAMGKQWLAQVENLRADAGMVMDFFPLTSNDLTRRPVELPADYASCVTSPRAVLDALLSEDVIDTEGYQNCLTSMAETVSHGKGLAAPLPGTRLLMPVELAVLFVEAGVLAFLSNLYRLEISQTEWDTHYSLDIVHAERDRQTEIWLTTLLNRLTTGLAQHRYRLLPEAPPRRGRNDLVDSPRHGVLSDVLNFQGTPQDLVWVDDRFLTGYPTVNASPLVGILDMLRLLKVNMGDGPYFRSLLKLRESQFRHLPLAADEILYWLKKAPVKQQLVQETHELDCLRQYWAALWLDRERLRLGNGEDEKPEIHLLSQASNSINKVLEKLWSDKRGSSKRQARSVWLLNNLHTSFASLDHLLPDLGPEARRLRLSLDLNGLLMAGLYLPTSNSNNTSRVNNPRRQFVEWLNSFYLAPRLLADPDCAVQVANHISRYMNMLLDNAVNDALEQLRIFQISLHRFLQALPEVIRKELHADKALMDRLGLRVMEVISIDNDRHHFTRNEFWRVAAMVIQRGQKDIQDTDQGAVWIMRRLESSSLYSAVELVQSERGFKFPLVLPQLGLLSPHTHERLAVLQAHRLDWLDAWDGDVAGAERELSNIESPDARITRLESWQARSAATFYSLVESNASNRANADIHDFDPPPVAALLRYFRLEKCEEGVPFHLLWERSVTRMLAELSLAETLIRTVCLPIPVPSCLLEALLAAPDAELRYDELLAMSTAPVSLLQALDLGLALSKQISSLTNKLESMLDHLASERGRHEFKILKAILSYTQSIFVNQREFRELSTPLRLALLWGHALAVHNRYQLHGGLANDAAEAISAQANNFPWHPRDDVSGWVRDAAHPHKVLHPYLVYHALGRILGKHEPACWHDLYGIAQFRHALDVPNQGEVIDSDTIWLVRESGWQADSLGSLFGGERQTALAPLLNADNDWYLTDRTQQRILDALTELERDPGYTEAWMHMVILSPDGEMDPQLLSRCQIIAQSADLILLYRVNSNLGQSVSRLVFTWLNDEQEVENCLLGWLMFWEQQGKCASDDDMGKPFATWITQCAHDYHAKQGKSDNFDHGFSGTMRRLFQASAAYSNVMALYMENLAAKVSAVDYPGLHGLCLHTRLRLENPH